MKYDDLFLIACLSMLLNSILLIGLLSPNIVMFIHKSFFNWKPKKELSEKEIEHLIEVIFHKELLVKDVGTKKYPDYVVGGTDTATKELLRLIYFIKNGKHETEHGK